MICSVWPWQPWHMELLQAGMRRCACGLAREDMLAKQMRDAEHMREEAVVKLWIQQMLMLRQGGHRT